MDKRDIRIDSTGGGSFDCYVVTPDVKIQVPAIVLASAVHGLDEGLREIADAFAENGYIAAAPDLFWRTIPGPLAHGDERTKERSQPREEKIATGEADMTDTLAAVRALEACNGKVATIGFCYGGPYAVLGPSRLGFDAGISCHGSLMLPYLEAMEGVTRPVAILWGDQDHAAPPEVIDAYKDAAKRIDSLEVHVFPDVKHGYMMRRHPNAWNEEAYAASMKRTLEILAGLREEGDSEALRRAS